MVLRSCPACRAPFTDDSTNNPKLHICPCCGKFLIVSDSEVSLLNAEAANTLAKKNSETYNILLQKQEADKAYFDARQATFQNIFSRIEEGCTSADSSNLYLACKYNNPEELEKQLKEQLIDELESLGFTIVSRSSNYLEISWDQKDD